MCEGGGGEGEAVWRKEIGRQEELERDGASARPAAPEKRPGQRYLKNRSAVVQEGGNLPPSPPPPPDQLKRQVVHSA